MKWRCIPHELQTIEVNASKVVLASKSVTIIKMIFLHMSNLMEQPI